MRQHAGGEDTGWTAGASSTVTVPPPRPQPPPEELRVTVSHQVREPGRLSPLLANRQSRRAVVPALSPMTKQEQSGNKSPPFPLSGPRHQPPK